MKITKRTVDAAAPTDRDRFLWDDELPGFGLRVWPSGRKTFLAQYRVGGGGRSKQRRFTIGTFPLLTAEEARLKAREVLSRARLGEDLGGARDQARNAKTVAELTELWLAEAAHINRRSGAPRTAQNVAGERGRISAHVLPLLGSRRLNDLTRADVERFRDQVARGTTAGEKKTKLRGRSRVRGGQGTATRTVRMLASIFAFAVDRGLMADNPARGVRLTPGQSMNRFLSPQELARLGEALAALEAKGRHPYALTIIRLLALTGARRGEITGLRWREIDFDRGLLRLETSKTGAKVLPLSAPAILMLQGQTKLEGSNYVFPAANGGSHFQGLGRIWQEAREAAGLEDVRLHDLRHTFASFGASGGLGLPVIGALLGHRQAATTARYAHLADDPLRAAAERIGGTIADAMAPPDRVTKVAESQAS